MQLHSLYSKPCAYLSSSIVAFEGSISTDLAKYCSMPTLDEAALLHPSLEGKFHAPLEVQDRRC